jgi:hypothetical protein
MPIDDIMVKTHGVPPPGARQRPQQRRRRSPFPSLRKFQLDFDAFADKIELDKRATELLASAISIIVNVFRVI